MSGPIAALGVWANLMVSVNSIDEEESISPASTPQRKSPTKKMAKTNVPPPPIRRAATNAKASAEVGADIRWDVIMQQIADIAPSAKFLEAAPMLLPSGFVKSKDLAEYSVSEDSLSTSAGDTSDSEGGFSDVETPNSRMKPPPGLAVSSMRLPPGLSAPLRSPPGLSPPPGFESFAIKMSHEQLPPWRGAQADRGSVQKATRPWRS